MLEKYPDQFKPNNFEHNKKKVEEVTTVDSNLLRNRIAGYITRKLATKEPAESPPSFE